MKHKYAILAVLLIGLFLRFYPLTQTNLLIGADGYYHFRTTAALIESGSIPSWDEFSFGGRPHVYPPGFHTLFGALQLLTGVKLRNLAILSGPIFYVLSALLTSLYSPVSAFFLSTIPVYVWRTTITFLVSGLWTFLIYIMLRLRTKKVALLFGIALALTHSSALVMLPLMAILNRNRKRSAVFWFSTVLASVWWIDVQNVYQGVPVALRSQIFDGVTLNMFAERAGIQGLLAILGIPAGGIVAITWTAVFATFVLAGLMELDRAIEASGLVIAYLAKKALPKKSKFIIPVLVLISTVWAFHMLSALDWGYISNSEQTGLDWIRENSLETSTVASTLGEGYWIEGYLARKNIMDGHFANMDDVDERLEDLKIVFSNHPEPAIEKYGISFILGSIKSKLEYGFEGNSDSEFRLEDVSVTYTG